MQNIYIPWNITSAKLSNLIIIDSTHEGALSFPRLTPTVKTDLVYPKFTNSSLLSIGQLCNGEFLAIFSKWIFENYNKMIV